MPVAYVFIRTAPGKEKEVRDRLRNGDLNYFRIIREEGVGDRVEVEEAHIVYGPWDIVAKVRAEDELALRGFVHSLRTETEGICEVRRMDVVENEL